MGQTRLCLAPDVGRSKLVKHWFQQQQWPLCVGMGVIQACWWSSTDWTQDQFAQQFLGLVVAGDAWSDQTISQSGTSSSGSPAAAFQPVRSENPTQALSQVLCLPLSQALILVLVLVLTLTLVLSLNPEPGQPCCVLGQVLAACAEDRHEPH